MIFSQFSDLPAMAHSIPIFLLVLFTILWGVATNSPITHYSTLRFARQACTTAQLKALRESLSNSSSCPNTIVGFAIDQVFRGQVSQEFVRSFCQPRCSNPVIEYYNTCVPADVGPGIAQSFIQLCSTNANGEKCFASAVIQAINAATIPCSDALNGSFCSTACRDAAEHALGIAECCVHLVDAAGTNFVSNISAVCAISAPDICNPTGNSSMTTTASTAPTSTTTSTTASSSTTAGSITGAISVTESTSAGSMAGSTVMSKELATVPLTTMTMVAAVLMSILVELC